MNASGLLTPANSELFARYLLAGFILMSVRASFVSAQRPRPTEIILDSVFLSLVNQLLFVLLLSVAFWMSDRLGHPLRPDSSSRPLFFAEVVVLPSVLGVFWGIALARDWKVASLRRLVMPNVHPTERACDYAFAQRPGPSFVIVTYADGTQVYGYFGDRSATASDEGRSDIYLERLYSVGDDGQWLEAEPSRSALLTLEGLRTIEFIPEGSTGNDPKAAR